MCKIIKIVCVNLILLGCIGCGYTFHSNLPSHLNKVYIENFSNKIEFTKDSPGYSSYFPGLENDITESVEERFVFEGSLSLADNVEVADIVLTGELIDYVKQPLRYTGDDIEEYRLSVVVNCKVKDSEKDEIMWEDRIVGDTTYFVQGTLTKTETEAVDDAVEDLARRIVEKTVIQW